MPRPSAGQHPDPPRTRNASYVTWYMSCSQPQRASQGGIDAIEWQPFVRLRLGPLTNRRPPAGTDQNGRHVRLASAVGRTSGWQPLGRRILANSKSRDVDPEKGEASLNSGACGLQKTPSLQRPGGLVHGAVAGSTRLGERWPLKSAETNAPQSGLVLGRYLNLA